MSTKNNEPDDDDIMLCCASCGKAEVDDIELNAIFSDTAAINVRRIIWLNMRKHVKSWRLNYVMKFYLDSRKAAIVGIVRFVFCRCQLMWRNQHCMHAAAK